MRDEPETTRQETLSDQISQAFLAAQELLTIYLGDRLGLYQALSAHGPTTPAGLATRSGTDERYVREWLEQQAVAGFVAVLNADAAPQDRKYTLPSSHREIFVDNDGLNYLAPFARIVVALAAALPSVAKAFKTGDGVPLAEYGEDMREGAALLGRPMFAKLLGTTWLPAMGEVHVRLQADPPALVADIGCGSGWSTLALASAYPKVTVHGIDSDQPSVSAARRNAVQVGVGERVTFLMEDAGDPSFTGHYDLVICFEALHDMAQPVEVLRGMRCLAAPGGLVIIVDVLVADTFTAPGDERERRAFCWSVLHCLPAGRVQKASAATGTVMREPTLKRYAHQAGFREVRRLPVDHAYWRFYRLLT